MQFTCNSCGIAFPTPEDQRSHMKSDWHRYNLKRRVASLPSISEDIFNSKVTKVNIKEEEQREREASSKGSKIRGRKGGKAEEDIERTVTKKDQRRKEKEALAEKKRQLLDLARKNMIENINNPKFEEVIPETIQEETTDVSEPIQIDNQNEIDSMEIDEEKQQALEEEKLMEEKLKNAVRIEPEFCLFCNKKFPNPNQAIQHMFKYHGLYIPEQKYLIDRDGLIAYLAEKIGLGNICLVCKYQGRSLAAVRAHMLSKMHCRIPYETENERMEISEFYDFSSTYEGKDVVVDGTEDNEEWEDVEEDGEMVDSEDEEDEDLPQDVALAHGFELHLPSGAVVGHRSLARYYRQNLAPERVLSEGQGTVIAAESRHMMTLADKQQYALTKRTWNNVKRSEDQKDRKAAKFINNQPHFRDPLLQ